MIITSSYVLFQELRNEILLVHVNIFLLRLSLTFQKLIMKYSISGIGCRFPGSAYLYTILYWASNNTESFWKILNEGSCCISEVPKDRWNSSVYSSNGTTEEGKSVTSKGGFIENVDKFDITFFNVAPKQANVMDPQQRMVLEVVYEALCDARIKVYISQ